MAKLQFMHSIYYDYAPVSFVNTWNKNNVRNLNQNLRNDELFMLPNPRIELFKKMPMYSLPYEWNISGDLKFYQNLGPISFLDGNRLNMRTYAWTYSCLETSTDTSGNDVQLRNTTAAT